MSDRFWGRDDGIYLATEFVGPYAEPGVLQREPGDPGDRRWIEINGVVRGASHPHRWSTAFACLPRSVAVELAIAIITRYAPERLR
jgi:hypothetical protein